MTEAQEQELLEFEDCPWCSQTFDPAPGLKGGRPKMFCSPECRSAREISRRRYKSLTKRWKNDATTCRDAVGIARGSGVTEGTIESALLKALLDSFDYMDASRVAAILDKIEYPGAILAQLIALSIRNSEDLEG